MDNLFKEWRAEPHHIDSLFISDGIINEELWKKANIKIVFLLKEAYHSNKDSGSWDLISFLKKYKAKGRTFKPLGQWANGIIGLEEKQELQPFSNKQDLLNKALASCAVVNIKKSSGNKASNDKNLQEYVSKDWKYLERQINLLKPNIIVCGRVWHLIKGHLTGVECISDLIYLHNDIYYINFWHPANRAADKMNYYALCSVIHHAKILKNT